MEKIVGEHYEYNNSVNIGGNQYDKIGTRKIRRDRLLRT